MARQSQPTNFKHSLWDRLTNPNLNRPPGGVGGSSASDVEQIKDAVRRDLEWLLNSRRPPHDIPDGFDSLDQSMMTYGLPDFTNITVGDPHELRAIPERPWRPVIKRLRAPADETSRVTFNSLGRRQVDRASLHYRIDALLRLDPSPEPIVFDTVLDLGNRAFSVRSDGS